MFILSRRVSTGLLGFRSMAGQGSCEQQSRCQGKDHRCGVGKKCVVWLTSDAVSSHSSLDSLVGQLTRDAERVWGYVLQIFSLSVFSRRIWYRYFSIVFEFNSIWKNFYPSVFDSGYSISVTDLYPNTKKLHFYDIDIHCNLIQQKLTLSISDSIFEQKIWK